MSTAWSQMNLTSGDEMYEDASLHNENGAWQMIFGVDTIPEYRCRGCAAALLNHVICEAKAQGRKGLVLTCKDKLVHYYAKFGFVSEGVPVLPTEMWSGISIGGCGFDFYGRLKDCCHGHRCTDQHGPASPRALVYGKFPTPLCGVESLCEISTKDSLGLPVCTRKNLPQQHCCI